MSSQTRPSSIEFVVTGIDPIWLGKVVAELSDFEMPEAVEGDDDLVVVRLKSGTKEPGSARRRLQKSLGDTHMVAPVLLDRSGAKIYPIGIVQIRFRSSPSDGEIRAFAKAHRLCRPTRNRYQPAQVSFRLTKPSQSFLPDIITKLSESPEVYRAWAETKAAYRRLEQTD